LKILVVAEDLSPPLDEGMKKTAWHLVRAWEKGHEVLTLTRRQPAQGLQSPRQIRIDKFFQHSDLCRSAGGYAPDVSIYFPEASATRNSFWRSRRLKLITRRPVAMMALQPRSYGLFDRYLIRRWAPDLLVAQSSSYARRLRELCPRVVEVPLGIDLGRFRPPRPEEKQKLKARFGMPLDRPIVLHVGHIKENRNLRDLCTVARTDKFQVVVLGSTSTRQEEAVLRDLEASGVTVIADYVESVEDLYRAADVYVFPVQAPDAAMDLPLSVLEAMATNLPVVTRPFGGLADRFAESESFRYYQRREDLEAAVQSVLNVPSRNRELVSHFSWENVAREILQHIALEKETPN
jgi:glycosyltransferase involved in cell wall biosynthesis